MLLFQNFCHFVLINLSISDIKSVYGILNLSKADLAAKLALSFPFTSMWLDIKHIRISLELDIAYKHIRISLELDIETNLLSR